MAIRDRIEPTVLSGGRPGRQSSRAVHLDMLIGFILFFTVLVFAMTVYYELTGENAVIEALILLCLVLGLVGLFRVRRKLN